MRWALLPNSLGNRCGSGRVNRGLLLTAPIIKLGLQIITSRPDMIGP